MGRVVKLFLKTMKWSFIVFLLYLGSLFFRQERLPGALVDSVLDHFVPTNLVIHVDSLSYGFRRGVEVRGFRLYDTGRKDPLSPVATAESVSVDFLSRSVVAEGVKYPRLFDSYYEPGNLERNERRECRLPDLGRFSLLLVRPDILSVRPEKVAADVEVSPTRLSLERAHLVWPEPDRRLSVDGRLSVDFMRQEVRGEVRGLARQSYIRPMLETLDVPVALPYFDGFTEVAEPVPAGCAWRVNLVNNDFDLDLDLHPVLGRYNSVPMKRADGRIHLHVYTRGTNLNYRQTFGPITGIGIRDQPLEGTVRVSGTNGFNTVDVEAKSALPVAELLRIGGFTGDYIGKDVFGDSECRLNFRFPRAMTNNYEVLNGSGHLSISNGHLMRMKGFNGLIKAMPAIAPGISWVSDTTQASCDYVIENGVIRSDNIYIEGTLFSIKMYGSFDAVKDSLDYIVRVQFTKKDSVMGMIIHPLTWPFTKLLLEFRLTGSAENPEWSYLSVVHRVLEAVK